MEFFSVKETAKLLDLGESTIRRYIKTGKLKGIKVGAKMRIYRKQIGIFIQKCNEKK